MELHWNLWFHVFIEKLEKGVNNKVTKFIDDTKLLRAIKIAANCEEMEDFVRKSS